MPVFLLRTILTMGIVVSASGCAEFKHFKDHNFNIDGALLTVENSQDEFQRVDLVGDLTYGARLPGPCEKSRTSRECLSAAFATFYEHVPPTPYRRASRFDACADYVDAHLGRLERARNRIQDHLIAASIVSCSDFEQQLNTFQSNTNFLLGLAAIGAGAAGSITTSGEAARALAGTAAALTGARAEWNSDLFAKMLVSTLTKAINTKREEWLAVLRGDCVGGHANAIPIASETPAIVTNSHTTEAPRTLRLGRQQMSIDVYSMEAAVGDALLYNDMCSLYRGLEFVNASVDTAANPGLDAMKSYLDKLKEVNTSLAAAIPEKKKTTTGSGGATSGGTGSGAGSGSGASGATPANGGGGGGGAAGAGAPGSGAAGARAGSPAGGIHGAPET